MMPITTADLGVFPVHGASKVQRVVQSYFFQEKLRKHGEEAALAYATSLGVDAKYHLEAQRNAKRKRLAHCTMVLTPNFRHFQGDVRHRCGASGAKWWHRCGAS